MIANVIAAGLALVLAIAATAKVYESRSLRDALRIGGLNDVAVETLVRVLPVAEVAVAGALIVGNPMTVRGALLAAACLFGTFTLWILVMLGRGLRPTSAHIGFSRD